MDFYRLYVELCHQLYVFPMDVACGLFCGKNRTCHNFIMQNQSAQKRQKCEGDLIPNITNHEELFRKFNIDLNK